MNNNINKFGNKAIAYIENLGLLVIAISTIIAVGIEINVMITNKTVTLADLLLLFIYLEVFTMVALYLNSGKLPVRIPMYIAIVALARYLTLDMKDMDKWKMLAVAASILIVTVAVLVHRYGHLKFPYPKDK